MKQHGLWQWHKTLHSSDKHVQWWLGAEAEEDARRVVHSRSTGFFKQYYQTPSAAVIRCASRYFRRKKIRPSVWQWNELVAVICERMDAHHMVLKKAQIGIDGGCPKPCTKLNLQPEEWYAPRLPYYRYQIQSRLTRITAKWAAIRHATDAVFKNSCAAWSELPSPKDWSYAGNHCPVCGGYFGPITRHNYKAKGDPRPHTKTDDFNTYRMSKPYLRVCKNNKCRAIAHYSRFVKAAKQGNKLLIGLINEAAKHKGNNPLFRGLAKHLARCA